jgi:hypothetical protein
MLEGRQHSCLSDVAKAYYGVANFALLIYGWRLAVRA